MDELRPAGLVFMEDSLDEISKACGFLWGRDYNFYDVYVNGHPVNISSSDLGEIKKQILEHYE